MGLVEAGVWGCGGCGVRGVGGSAEGRGLGAAVVPKGQGCRGELEAQAVGHGVYGLQSLGDSAEVRGLVAALTPKVQGCLEELNAQPVGDAASALRPLADSAAAPGLVAALPPPPDAAASSLPAMVPAAFESSTSRRCQQSEDPRSHAQTGPEPVLRRGESGRAIMRGGWRAAPKLPVLWLYGGRNLALTNR